MKTYTPAELPRIRARHRLYDAMLQSLAADPRCPTNTTIDGVRWSLASYVSQRLEQLGVTVTMDLSESDWVIALANAYEIAFGFVPEIENNES